ncbi:hypothetical protein GJ496_007488 [Pomphorhynchus laevis]|nr:hypothetical protein GJ496_007488 [Pomphorhynchus laevis]
MSSNIIHLSNNMPFNILLIGIICTTINGYVHHHSFEAIIQDTKNPFTSEIQKSSLINAESHNELRFEPYKQLDFTTRYKNNTKCHTNVKITGNNLISHYYDLEYQIITTTYKCPQNVE